MDQDQDCVIRPSFDSDGEETMAAVSNERREELIQIALDSVSLATAPPMDVNADGRDALGKRMFKITYSRDGKAAKNLRRRVLEWLVEELHKRAEFVGIRTQDVLQTAAAKKSVLQLLTVLESSEQYGKDKAFQVVVKTMQRELQSGRRQKQETKRDFSAAKRRRGR